MKRVLWLGIGLAIGALVVRAASKKARSLSPEGLAASARDTAGGILESVRNFMEDVREGMAEREDQIHAAIAEGIALDEDDLALDADDYSPEDFGRQTAPRRTRASLATDGYEFEEGKPRR